MFSIFPDCILRYETNQAAENLLEGFQRLLTEVGLERKQITHFTIDQGSNYLRLVKKLLAVPFLNCIAHKMHHVMEDAIKDNQHCSLLLDRCQEVHTHFAQSNVDSAKLSKAKTNLGLGNSELQSFSQTRFLSRSKQVDSILMLLPALQTVAIESVELQETLPSAEDEPDLKGMSAIFKRVTGILTIFESQSIPHISEVLVVLGHLHQVFETPVFAVCNSCKRWSSYLS